MQKLFDVFPAKSALTFLVYCLVGAALFPLLSCRSADPDTYTWDEVRRLVSGEDGAVPMDDGDFIVLAESLIAGASDPFIFVGYKPNCGVGTCDFMLFREVGASAPKTFHLVANIFGYPRVGGDIHNGWYDIEVTTRLGSEESRLTLTYDGKHYR